MSSSPVKMSGKPLRLLVSGDVEGNFDQLFSRIRSLQNKSGNFDLLLCVGNFFGDDASQWEPYASGQAKVPVSTLILGPNDTKDVPYYKEKDGAELCENVTYLGKKGTFTGSSGLQIAYLSGLESSNSDDTHFSQTDLSALTMPALSNNNFQGVDILMTSQWSKGVDKYSIQVDGFDTSAGSEAISQLAMILRPRYHFSGLHGIYYERQPYRNHKVLAEKERHVTRFLALAKVGNKEKKKYLYAFNIVPLSSMDKEDLTKQPQGSTECPYKIDMSAIKEKEEGKAQFFYDMNSGKSAKKRQHEGDDTRAKKQSRKPPQPTGPCWFCLGSPEVEKHLVTSVGTQTYLALAKGGLVDDHVLILPIGHYQSTVTSPTEVLEEIDKYKSALKKYHKTHGKAVVFFERNYKTQHLQIQAVPIPQDCVQEVKESFMEGAESESFELHEIPKHSDIKQIVPPGAPYFYAELPTGDKLLHRISKYFPLQFGRDVLCTPALLNMPERVDWKVCKLTKEDETDCAKLFKTKFKDYDFNFT